MWEKDAQASIPVTLLLREGQSRALSHLSHWNSFGVRLCGSQDGTSLQVSSKWDTRGAKTATAQAEDNWDMLPDSGAPQQPQAEQWLQKLVFLPLTVRAAAPIMVTRLCSASAASATTLSTRFTASTYSASVRHLLPRLLSVCPWLLDISRIWNQRVTLRQRG